MANDYLLQEDGVSKIALEDGTGFIILESSGGGGPVTDYYDIYHRYCE